MSFNVSMLKIYGNTAPGTYDGSIVGILIHHFTSQCMSLTGYARMVEAVSSIAAKNEGNSKQQK